MRNLRLYSFGILFSCSLAACANVAQQPNNLIAADTTGQISSSGDISTQGQDACSIDQNINPADEIGYNNTTNFTYRACAGSTDGTVQLFAEDKAVKPICVFPLTVVNGQATPVPTGYTDLSQAFVYSCQNTQASGVTFSFNGITFNSIYVVNQANAASFSVCLNYNDLYTCAESMNIEYSYGSF